MLYSYIGSIIASIAFALLICFVSFWLGISPETGEILFGIVAGIWVLCLVFRSASRESRRRP